MLTTKEAIEKRRSIRKFKPQTIPQKILDELIESARLAPSGGNAQPWYFKIVTDQDLKTKLAEAAYNQQFVAQAPVIIVCCANLKEYANNVDIGAQHLANSHEIEPGFYSSTIKPYAEYLRSLTLTQLGTIAGIGVTICIEHIMLRALDYELGSCWVTPNSKKVCDILGWDENMYVVALLPLGYPAENPNPRSRKPIAEIVSY